MINQKLELNPQQIVLVLGGYGFIGKHVVEQLDNLGAYTLIGTRGHRQPRQPGERRIALHQLSEQGDLSELLEGVDVAVNAVGILRQRFNETYEQVHHHAVASLVTVCAKKKIRYVHISAPGLNNSVKSRFLHSKHRGEEVIKASSADWYIVRSSLVDGEAGYGAKWMRRVANWPIHLMPHNAKGLLAPINVRDLGEAVARIALMVNRPSNKELRTVELGGNQVMGLMDYLTCLSHREPLARIRVPAMIVRLCSHFFDVFQITPLSFGHYELLKFDNIPRFNRISDLLGRPPMLVNNTVPCVNREECNDFQLARRTSHDITI